MGWLVGVYIAAAVFGGGITLIDLLGLLGHGGDHGGADHGGSAHDAGAHHAGPTLHAHETEGRGTAQASLVAPDAQPPRAEIGLRVLSAARTLVYFCFGFGPIGWIASAFGAPPASSLLWSIPTGLLFAATGLALRRFQRMTLDSQVRDSDLLMETAEVVVPIEPSRVGKVRFMIGGGYVERFARARDPSVALAKGTRVRVVSSDEDGVVVSEE